MNITYQEQFLRRKELRANPSTMATGVHTAGLGSTGNTSHINLNKPLTEEWLAREERAELKRQAKIEKERETPKRNPLLDYPMGKRERQIIQLALSGNKAEMIETVLSLQPGEAKRVCERWGIEP